MRELWECVAPVLAGAAVVISLYVAVWSWYIVLTY